MITQPPFIQATSLFSDDSIEYLVGLQRKHVNKKLDAYSSQYVITSAAEIVESLITEYRLVTPELDTARVYTAYTGDTKIDIRFDGGRDHQQDATLLIVGIPFSGYRVLFDFRPSVYQSYTPRGEAKGSVLFLEYILRDSELEGANARIQQDIEVVNFFLGNVANDVDKWNTELRSTVISSIEKKQERYRRVQKMVGNLTISSGLSSTSSVLKSLPIETIHIHLTDSTPDTAQKDQKPDYRLSDGSFNDILAVLEDAGRFFELNPEITRDKNECPIRDLFLFALNVRCVQGASSETFVRRGHTDILLKSPTQGLFIAECKLWRGSSYISNGYTQLLDYLSWRETKACMLVFYKGAAFSSTLDKIRKLIEEHPNFIRFLPYQHSGEIRCVMNSNADRAVEVEISTLAFNFPK